MEILGESTSGVGSTQEGRPRKSWRIDPSDPVFWPVTLMGMHGAKQAGLPLLNGLSLAFQLSIHVIPFQLHLLIIH